MADLYKSIFENGALPSDAGVYPQNFGVLATNDNWLGPILAFEDTGAKIGFHGSFRVPENYVGSASLVIEWSAGTTSGNAVWDFDCRAVGGDDAESMDQSSWQESVTGTDAAPSAIWEKNSLTISLTSGNFAAGDIVQFKISRDGADASDTLAATIAMFGAYFKYADA